MIFIECYNDEVLMKALGFKRREWKHEYSKGNVCNSLFKNTDSIGIIDEDPSWSQPSYLKNLHRDEIYISQNIILYHDNSRKNCLVMICPNLEGWILKITQQAKITLSIYNLPGTEKELHAIGMNKNKLRNLANLIKDLKQSEMLLPLHKLLRKSKF